MEKVIHQSKPFILDAIIPYMIITLDFHEPLNQNQTLQHETFNYTKKDNEKNSNNHLALKNE